MDRAVTKSSKLIKLHSITVKPKTKPGPMSEKEKEFYNQREFNRWVDDAYYLMGKSYFHKDVMNNAWRCFDYVAAENRRKPERFPALLWQAKIKNQQGYYDEAIELMNKAAAEPDMPPAMRGQQWPVYAEAYIGNMQYPLAIDALEKAIEAEKKKKPKARYAFILAQLHSMQGDKVRSMEMYQQVLEFNPDYDMAFRAKINMATQSDGSSLAISKQLRKMLRDSKNKEYRDQIYYAMANIAFQQGQTAKAVEYYLLSAKLSTQNNYQKDFHT
jgi:tetratricopeptide (TPR) repeat protein